MVSREKLRITFFIYCRIKVLGFIIILLCLLYLTLNTPNEIIYGNTLRFSIKVGLRGFLLPNVSATSRRTPSLLRFDVSKFVNVSVTYRLQTSEYVNINLESTLFLLEVLGIYELEPQIPNLFGS